MTRQSLSLEVETFREKETLSLEISRLVVAGWVGKDKARLQEHIEELGKLGVPAPSRTPTYMNLSPMLLTTGETIDVISGMASGEVECVLFRKDGRIFVGVGSDHTDRDFEKYGIPASKQMCAKPVAPTVWDLDDVRDHLDRIILRSWMTCDGNRRLYQEGALADNLSVLEILEGIPSDDGLDLDSLCLFCGTFPALEGILYGELFEFEMEDPVLGRSIRHAYRQRVLPQYL
ncbi:Protein of unknown function [Desulfacinum infernum DSM 9756]|uniref:DUF2848 domain-containing protein n=1 Tax=Desulfacinum infernum DSM 9756 TaxID=1121391 RepID=A0A1M4UEW5_9BACT|nr:DUF2848 domain-containing protein [Desulfacinum infernum]SHE55275.1 Protein of unknown function [Desulfacinum infernum DSM 9756]